MRFRRVLVGTDRHGELRARRPPGGWGPLEPRPDSPTNESPLLLVVADPGLVRHPSLWAALHQLPSGSRLELDGVGFDLADPLDLRLLSVFRRTVAALDAELDAAAQSQGSRTTRSSPRTTPVSKASRSR